jgi:hypothetical protein
MNRAIIAERAFTVCGPCLPAELRNGTRFNGFVLVTAPLFRLPAFFHPTLSGEVRTLDDPRARKILVQRRRTSTPGYTSQRQIVRHFDV